MGPDWYGSLYRPYPVSASRFSLADDRVSEEHLYILSEAQIIFTKNVISLSCSTFTIHAAFQLIGGCIYW